MLISWTGFLGYDVGLRFKQICKSPLMSKTTVPSSSLDAGAARLDRTCLLSAHEDTGSFLVSFQEPIISRGKHLVSK